LKTFRRIFVLLIVIIIQAHSQGKDELIKAGDELYGQLRTEEALHVYEQAYVLAPRDSGTLTRLIRAYSDLGWLHLHKDSTSESFYLHAIAFADSLLELYPNLPESHFWFALANGSMIPFKSTSEKISIGKIVRMHAERALELDSTFAYAYILLAIFEREGAKLSWFEHMIARIVFGGDLKGSYDKSIDLLQKALKYDPNNMYAYFELSRTYDAMDEKQDAIAALEKATALPVHSEREQLLRSFAERSLSKMEGVRD
jgi:tetratricopeptide (TPR) repeat protein